MASHPQRQHPFILIPVLAHYFYSLSTSIRKEDSRDSNYERDETINKRKLEIVEPAFLDFKFL
jgi:hypothetical protein